MAKETMPTPEDMAQISKERIKSDAKLAEKGVDVTPDGKIIPTQEQQDKIAENHKEIVRLEKQKGDLASSLNNTPKYPEGGPGDPEYEAWRANDYQGHYLQKERQRILRGIKRIDEKLEKLKNF